jgi:hypothetical protein
VPDLPPADPVVDGLRTTPSAPPVPVLAGHLVLILVCRCCDRASASSTARSAYPDAVDSTTPTRGAQAFAVAALGVPAVLLAHLLTTGAVVGPAAAAGVVLADLVVAASLPARSRTRLALVTAAAQAAGHAVLALATAGGPAPSGCIPVVGRGARLGLHLALLRADASCPAGTLAPGPAATPTAAALTAVLAALTVIAGHAIAAALTGALLAAGARAADTVRAVRGLAASLAALPARGRLLLAAVRTLAPPVTPPHPAPAGDEPVPKWYPDVAPLRGPPAAACRVRLLPA